MTFTNPKRKAAYTLTSVGIPIADNDSNVGQKMLKKMGWIPETGLGKDRNGIVDPIKATCNYGRKGLGRGPTQSSTDMVQQSAYNALLQSLSKHKSHVIPEVKIKLEEKSKSSRSRVHYGRLIRAKDVSQYAQESLKIVLGASQDRSPQSSPDRGKSYSDQEDSIRHEFGVKTYSSNTDLHSYFSMKRKAMKYSPKERSPKIMREHSPISKSVEDVSSLSATSCSNDSPKGKRTCQTLLPSLNSNLNLRFLKQNHFTLDAHYQSYCLTCTSLHCRHEDVPENGSSSQSKNRTT
ncbi:unnamed protein product [Mesocestoides corti]|uniref:G-patch domain-containing protein n=1 Tax=Mesocestoides corti TaxID=53468 RepID=A0A0R3U2Q9_MESCO|nr:unnamed protein product [Mesocestoides corti]